MSAQDKPKRRVVITGLGANCSIGANIEEFWSNCIEGVTNVERIPQHWSKFSSYDCKFWSPLSFGDALETEFTRVQRLTLDPCARLAILTAKEALEKAGYSVYKSSRGGYRVPEIVQDQVGVFMGTGVGGISSLLENHAYPVLSRNYKEITELEEEELSSDARSKINRVKNRMVFPRRINPFIVSMLMPNAVSANIGLLFELMGQNTTYTVACAAGTVAIGNAFRAVQRGDVNVAIAGGSEYLDDYYGYIFRGFDVAGTLAKGGDAELVNRPFDKDRTGFLLSQGGSAALILEELETALSRQAPIVAEVKGFGESFDAHNIMQMGGDSSQIERMIRNTISDAGLEAQDIDYINAHGTGTKNNDDFEADVLEKIFNKKPIVNSTKSLVGHSIGASGALEAVVTACSLKYQTTHACKNLQSPNSGLNFVRNVANFSLDNALTQSFAFGGHNSALVLSRYDA